MKLFYVYAYLRTDLSPYYIGKGKNRRAWQKHRIKNEDGTWTGPHLPKDKNRIVLLTENITETEAFNLEKSLIKQYGRKGIDAYGILHNKTKGGEGFADGWWTNKKRPQQSKWMSGEDNPAKHHKAKLKTVYHIYTGETKVIPVEENVTLPFTQRPHSRHLYAETLDGIVIGLLNVKESIWRSGEVRISNRTNTEMIKFLSKINSDLNTVMIKLDESNLSLKQRTTFVERLLKGKSVSEVAEILNCSEGSIKTHLSRAKNKISKLLNR